MLPHPTPGFVRILVGEHDGSFEYGARALLTAILCQAVVDLALDLEEVERDALVFLRGPAARAFAALSPVPINELLEADLAGAEPDADRDAPSWPPRGRLPREWGRLAAPALL